MITSAERLAACLRGEILDRPPVALWRHFPVDDQSPQELASSVIAFQEAFGFDLVKVTPASSYCLKDWGVDDEWRGDPEGTRTYTRRVIHHPEDWAKLSPLDPQHGHLAAQLECLRQITAHFGAATPVIETIFSPLAQAKNLVGGEALLVHLRRYPQQVHAGLRIITESTLRYVEALRTTGVAGIFYAIQHAQYGLLSEEEYRHFGRPYDLQILERAADMEVRMLHLHGSQVMFDLVVDYPVNLLNWHDRETPPSLEEGLTRFSGAVCGGVSRSTLVYGTPQEVRRQALEALQVNGGRRVVLGTGCVTPIIAPLGNLRALRQSVIS